MKKGDFTMKAAVIIGGGPAGCQCALWLQMLGCEAVIVEKTDKLGGLQCNSPYTNNWIVGTVGLTGQEIAANMDNHIKQMGISVYYNNTVTAIKKRQQGFEISVHNDVINAHNIVISTGVNPRSFGHISSDKIILGPGRQISEFDFSNKNVAILGGGDNAAENYAFIKGKNPKQCHLYAKYIKARKNLWDEVNPLDVSLGEHHVNQQTMVITCNGLSQQYDVIIVLYGWEANIPSVFELFKSDLLNDNHFIHTDHFRRTNIPNIYAAGEVAECPNPCVTTAMADGVVAAKSIQWQLS